MESDEIREQLREAERAAAAPYVIYPKYLWWHVVLLSLAGPLLSLVLAQTLLGLAGGTAMSSIPSLTISMTVIFVVFDQRRRSGTFPQGRAPLELRKVYRWYFIGASVALVVIVSLALTTPLWLSLPASFAAALTGLIWFGNAYERAATKVRTRLA